MGVVVFFVAREMLSCVVLSAYFELNFCLLVWCQIVSDSCDRTASR